MEIVDDFNEYSRKRYSGGHSADALVPSSSSGNNTGVGQEDSYNVTLGQRYVLQCKYLVTFRLVDTFLVFYVCEPDRNPMLSLRYVDAAAKILVGLSKGIDISAKRLSKRYSDLHYLLGRLLSQGIGYLPAAFIHAPATNEKLLTMPVSAFDATRKLKKMAKTKTEKNEFVKRASEGRELEVVEDKGHGEDPLQAVWRASGHDVRMVEFSIPPEALPPPPNRVMGAKRTPPAPPMLGISGTKAFVGAAEGDSDDDEVLTQVSVDEVMEKEDGEVVDMEQEMPVNEEEEEEDAALLEDLQEALVMVELWKATVVSGRIRSAHVSGEIRRGLAPYNIDKAAFRVNSSGSLAVDSCMQVAARHASYVHRGAGGAFEATLSGTPIDASFVKYILPSATVNPPLQADLRLVYSDTKKKEVLVCIPLAVNPLLKGGLVDVSVMVSLPPDVKKLVKTSHKAVWSPDESRIQWTFERLEAGSQESIRAIVSCDSFDRIPQYTRSIIVFSGYPGQSLSGLSFDLAIPRTTKEQVFHPGKRIRTFGEMELSLYVPQENEDSQVEAESAA
jgi:hypothetical protein